MTANSIKHRTKISFFSVLTNLLTDIILISLGFALYYNFAVSPFLPFTTINPVFTAMVGGFNNAVYIISGLPFLVGAINLLRTIGRVFQSIIGR